MKVECFEHGEVPETMRQLIREGIVGQVKAGEPQELAYLEGHSTGKPLKREC